MYSQRKAVGEEYKRGNYSKANMIEEHGEALGSVKRLLISIRNKNKKREEE